MLIRTKTWRLARLLLIIPAAAGLTSCQRSTTVASKPSASVGPVPIRIGWNTTWATEGQIIQVLKRTDVLESNGLKGVFLPFSYGGPLSEAALAGSLDVLSAADQPSITLISKDPNWIVIGRCIEFRDALVVPPASTIRKVSDLRGKVVAVPFGSGAHRATIQALEAAGLKEGPDVRLLNLDIAEINSTIRAGGQKAKRWSGGIDAAAVWDPGIAIHEATRDARVIHQVQLLGLRTMSKDFVRQHPDAPKRFLKAIATAELYYVHNKSQANKWFAEDARIALNEEILNKSASFDPNTKAKSISQLDLGLSDAQIRLLDQGAQFAWEKKLITTKPNMRKAVDLSYLHSAMDELNTKPPDLSQIQQTTN